MAAEIITHEDLQFFKEELISVIRTILNALPPPTAKKWIKFYQVKETGRSSSRRVKRGP